MNKELIFQNIPDKREYKNTTSLKFKEDLNYEEGDSGISFIFSFPGK